MECLEKYCQDSTNKSTCRMSQTFQMELFANIVNSLKGVYYFWKETRS